MLKVYRVLFLSQRDTVRSVLAEAILNHVGRGHFQAISAGVRPSETIEPVVYELLAGEGIPYAAHVPKHYLDLVTTTATLWDFVFTLSEVAAGEVKINCPGDPIVAHWGIEDSERPATEYGRRAALTRILSELERRLRLFVTLPLETLDRQSLHKCISDLGATLVWR